MPDLATHALISHAGARVYGIIRPTRPMHSTTVYLFVLGNVLPDILDKTIPYMLYYLYPGSVAFPVSFSFLHTPMMLLLSVYVFCLLFTETYRKIVFALLLTGVSIHLILDLLQGNICEIGYMWFFPFSTAKPMVLNLFYDDSTVPLIPVFAVIVLGIEIAFHMIRKRSLLPSSAREL